MSDEPPYGYMECVFRHCSNQVPMHLDPADFSLHPKCRDCRTKMRSHSMEPFCRHGNKISSWSKDPPLPCGCTLENDIDEATWDWVEKPARVRTDQT